jgi:putative redox protein
VTALLYARRKGWAVNGIEVDLRYRREGEGDHIDLALRIGGDLTEDQHARLREVSRRCPVHRMLAGRVEITEAAGG